MANILYEDEFIKLSFDDKTHLIIKDWQKEISAERFKEIIVMLLVKIVEVSTENKDKNINIFVDARKLGATAFTEENIAWLDKNVHPIYAMYRIAKKAFFVNKDIATNLPVVKYITTNNNTLKGIVMSVYTDEQEAKNWLMG